MLTLKREPDREELEKPCVFSRDETPQLTYDEVGALWTSQHTHSLLECAWTDDAAGELDRFFEVTEVAFATISAPAALASQCIGKGCFIVMYSPSDDTSNTIDYVPELKRRLRPSAALWRGVSEMAERCVATIRSDSELSVGELRQRLQQRAPVSQDLAARQRELLARAGGGLTATEVAQRMNVSEQEVDELRTAERLLAVPDPDGPGWSYPRCQFEGPRVVLGLSEVLSDFAVKSPWTRLYVLIGEDPALDGRTPVEALKDGDLDMVREIVRGYGQQGGD